MKGSRSDYKICPFCGATLDISEQCDCEKGNNGFSEPSFSNKNDESKEIIYPLQAKAENKGK